MSENPTLVCATCGAAIEANPCGSCMAMREAAAAGAQPKGVPLRVYGGYLEARAALRANANGAATRVLQWLLGHIAEERGVAAEQSFSKKLEKLTKDGVISARMQPLLSAHAEAASGSAEQAWALMSVVESAFYKLYLH